MNILLVAMVIAASILFSIAHVINKQMDDEYGKIDDLQLGQFEPYRNLMDLAFKLNSTGYALIVLVILLLVYKTYIL